MTPFASVAMLEKLALLKIARCRAPALSSVSSAWMLSSSATRGCYATLRLHSVCQRTEETHIRDEHALNPQKDLNMKRTNAIRNPLLALLLATSASFA